MFLYCKNKKWENNASPVVKAVRIILLILIIVGLVLIFTKNLWVPKLVDYILGSGSPTQSVIIGNQNNLPVGSEDQFFSQNLKTFVDDKTGLTFEYPDKVLTKYIDAVDWPPKAQVLQQPFTCNETEGNIDQGQIQKEIINGRDYCVTKESEGAAGSIYTTYTYAFPYNNETVSLTFSLRLVQCDNYDDPQKAVCKQEQALFNPDNVVDQMAESLTFKIQPEAQSGVEGMVTLGPTCPVQRNPPDPTCADKPYATSIQVIKIGSPNGSPFATTKSDQTGKYKIMLPPGDYTLQSVGGSVLPRCETKNITIVSSQILEADITCDTGITTDLERRVREHNETKKGAKYTMARRPVKLVYSRRFKNRSNASREEVRVKKLTRIEKLVLIKKSR